VSHVFKHPKYYKELQASLKKEAISSDGSTDPEERAPSSKPQASSTKPQASSTKQVQVPDASVKPQAQRVKRQAASDKLPDS
jgi:hypothetical protein